MNGIPRLNHGSDPTLPNYTPKESTYEAVLQVYDTAFNKTRLEVRYALHGNVALYNVGFHDVILGVTEKVTHLRVLLYHVQ